MTVNSVLLVQAAIATTAAAPAGMGTGEWIALASLFVVMAGVVYKAGVASQKSENVETLVESTLTELNKKMDALLAAQIDRVRFEENIDGRVRRLEGDSTIHLHQRASDR